MNDFHARQSSLDRALLDPAQHVHYAQGMVLGADDFNQEFAWLSGRDQWLSRDALGYGTYCGLHVQIAEHSGKVEVVVGSGAAVTPSGKWVRVPLVQCADLGAWIAAHPEALHAGIENEHVVDLQVTLFYEECLTDPVPVPGDACRTEDDSLQPSRITDHFRLELSVVPKHDRGPSPREEEAVRRLVAWLRERITIAEKSVGFSRPEFVIADLRAAAESLDFPPVADRPDGKETEYAEPNPKPRQFVLSPPDAERCIREALRVWIVELRERWHPDRFPLRHGPRPTDQRPVEEGVLLARIRAMVAPDGTGGWTLYVPGPEDEGYQPPSVDESTRPWVMHLRLLQEMVLQQLKHVPPPGDRVKPEQRWGKATNPGTAVAYSRTDHTHGTPLPTGDVVVDEDTDHDRPVIDANALIEGRPVPVIEPNVPIEDRPIPVRPDRLPLVPSEVADEEARLGRLDGRFAVDEKSQPLRVVALQRHPVHERSPVRGDALVWTPTGDGPRSPSAWTPTSPDTFAVKGDVTGPLGDTTVERLRRNPLADAQPNPGDVLAWRSGEEGDAWTPKSPGEFEIGTYDSGDVRGTLAQPTVHALQGVPIQPGVPNQNDVLTFDGEHWLPRAPAAAGAADAVLRPSLVKHYQIVAAGLIPLMAPDLPSHGVPKLRVTERWHDAYHALVEFTYDGHAALFKTGMERRLAPSYGFVVKATLIQRSRHDEDSEAQAALLRGGLEALKSRRGQLLEELSQEWLRAGAITIGVEAVTSVGILLRVSTPDNDGLRETLNDASLMVEVSWCPDFQGEGRLDPPRPEPIRPG